MVLADTEVTPDMTATYVGLGRHVQGRQTKVSIPRLQAYTGRARATVSSAIARLAELAYLSTTHRAGNTIEYELLELPDVPADRLCFDVTAGRFDHVRTPVVLLDDDRVDALAFTLWAAAAWFTIEAPNGSHEVPIADLARLAQLSEGRRGVQTVKGRFHKLTEAGYVKAASGRGTVLVTWAPCPPVPADHVAKPPVDDRRRTPSSGARSSDPTLLDDHADLGGPHGGSEGPLGPAEATPDPDAKRAPDDGVETSADQGNRAADREVRAPGRGERAPDREVRAPDRDDLDTPPSPFGREGGVGDNDVDVDFDAHDRDSVEAYVVRHALAEHLNAGQIARFIDQVLATVPAGVTNAGQLFRAVAAARNRSHQPPQETSPL